ncbi:MAG: carboxypeptidase regulatory-like domain-containing protein [Clostridia bacterium]|nr:carboxypeptidase regulatory-like domain-containing protein [Clostridia bacterium]
MMIFMADNELERLISRYSQELLNYAKRSPSSGTENDKGDELRRFDDGFMALEELRDRQSGEPADNDQSEPLNAAAKNNANTNFSDGLGNMGGGMGDMGNESGEKFGQRPFFGAIINGAFGEATDEDTPPPIIFGDMPSDMAGDDMFRFGEVLSGEVDEDMFRFGDRMSPSSQGDTVNQSDTMSQTNGDIVNQSDTMSQNVGKTVNQSDTMSQFMGGLEVAARTASEALPVEGALVIVTSPDGDGGRFEQVALTDRSGLARIFNLPAANPENSQTFEGVDKYFLYSVSISKPGFYDMESRDVPLFGGVVSRQEFALVPLPEGLPNELIENENTEPDDLR